MAPLDRMLLRAPLLPVFTACGSSAGQSSVTFGLLPSYCSVFSSGSGNKAFSWVVVSPLTRTLSSAEATYIWAPTNEQLGASLAAGHVSRASSPAVHVSLSEKIHNAFSKMMNGDGGDGRRQDKRPREIEEQSWSIEQAMAGIRERLAGITGGDNEDIEVKRMRIRDLLVERRKALESVDSYESIVREYHRFQSSNVPTGRYASPAANVSAGAVEGAAATESSEQPKEEKVAPVSESKNNAEKPAAPSDELKKKAKKKKEAEPSKPAENDDIHPGRLDFRVGKIVECDRHPDADSLYVEKIDLAEANPRTIVSGLVKHVPVEEMRGRLVVVLCNLKPAKMRGVLSEGMVMCASTPEKVEILAPPEGAVPGDVITFTGFPRNPDPVLNPKKKVWESLMPDFRTGEDTVAKFKDVSFEIEGKGVVKSPTLTGVQIK